MQTGLQARLLPWKRPRNPTRAKMVVSNRIMSDAIALDLYIQDFVVSNKLLNHHYLWSSLVSRRYLEPGIRVFSFESGGQTQYAVGSYLILPDSDWLRIELAHDIPAVEEHRFDCLRMTHAATHTRLEVETEASTGSILVKVLTKNRGLINIVFVIRPSRLSHPLLAAPAV